MADFFESLSDVEAQAFFDAYLSFRVDRLELLRREFEEGGGDALRDLDNSPKSLVRLWRWGIHDLHLLDVIYAPAWLDEYSKLIVTSFDDWLPKTPEAILLDAIAFYFADVCIGHLPGVRWEVCRLECIHFNQPVLGGFKFMPYEPRGQVQLAASKVINRKGSDECLLDSFHILARNVGPPVE